MTTKPMKRATITKFRLDELAGVDRGAQDVQPVALLKRKAEDKPETMVATTKRAALTTAVMGHTHTLNCIDDMQSGCTSYDYSYAEGAASMTSDYYRSGHSHSWIRAEDGTIVLGESAGHTHELATMTKVAKAKDDSKSSHATEAARVASMKPVVLTEKQFAHYKSLSDADGEVYVAKSFADREVDITKALEANPIVFTGEVTKTVVRKSDGDLALQLAKQNEATQVELAKTRLAVDVEKSMREAVELRKRATDTLGNLAGPDDGHVALMKACEGIADEKQREAAMTTLKSANAVLASKSKAAGIGGQDNPQAGGDPFAALEVGVTKFAKANNIASGAIWSDGLDAFVRTPEGEALKRAYDAALVG